MRGAFWLDNSWAFGFYMLNSKFSKWSMFIIHIWSKKLTANRIKLFYVAHIIPKSRSPDIAYMYMHMEYYSWCISYMHSNGGCMKTGVMRSVKSHARTWFSKLISVTAPCRNCRKSSIPTHTKLESRTILNEIRELDPATHARIRNS